MKRGWWFGPGELPHPRDFETEPRKPWRLKRKVQAEQERKQKVREWIEGNDNEPISGEKGHAD